MLCTPTKHDCEQTEHKYTPLRTCDGELELHVVDLVFVGLDHILRRGHGTFANTGQSSLSSMVFVYFSMALVTDASSPSFFS